MHVDRHVRDVILGRQTHEDEPEETPPRFFEGKITDVTATGIRFVVPAWDRGKYEFGPMPYPLWDDMKTNDGGTNAADHKHVMVGPQKGQTCLVVFLGNNADTDTQQPWVLGWRW